MEEHVTQPRLNDSTTALGRAICREVRGGLEACGRADADDRAVTAVEHPGTRARVRLVSATTLTMSWSRSWPGGICSNRPAVPKPALLTSRSTMRPWEASQALMRSAASGAVRSW